MDDQQGFYVVLPSNSRSEKLGLKNTLSHYVTELSRPLNLKAKWKVALCECSYPVDIYNISFDFRVHLKMFKNNDSEQIDTNVAISSIGHEFIVRKGQYKNVDAFLNTINEVMKSQYERMVFRSITAVGKCPKFEYNAVTKKVVFHYTNVNFSGYHYKCFPVFVNEKGNQNIQRMIGFRDIKNNVLDDDEETKIEADDEIDLKVGSNFLFVYSDITQPIQVGNTDSPLLRSMPLQHEKDGSIVTERFHHLFYMPVSRYYIPTILIHIADENGNQIAFGKGRVQVILHFKPV